MRVSGLANRACSFAAQTYDVECEGHVLNSTLCVGFEKEQRTSKHTVYTADAESLLFQGKLAQCPLCVVITMDQQTS